MVTKRHVTPAKLKVAAWLSRTENDEQWLAALENQALQRPHVREIVGHPGHPESVRLLAEASSNTTFAVRLLLKCRRCRAGDEPIEHVELLVNAHNGALRAAGVKRDKAAEELRRTEEEAPPDSTQRDKSERRVQQTASANVDADAARSDRLDDVVDAHLRRMNRARKNRAASKKPATSGRSRR